ncbi:hypothetical protein Dimus_020242 [Dionaea muscipula]
MVSPSALLCSSSHPVAVGLFTASTCRASSRHFSKHLVGEPGTPIPLPSICSVLPRKPPHFTSFAYSSSKFGRTPLARPIKSSFTESPSLENLWNLSFESAKAAVSQLTPLGVCKWAAVAAIGISASKWTANLLFNPFFWMYFSWTWMFWPWLVALVVGAYGVYSFWRYLRRDAGVYDQVAIAVAAFTWLTLVPPGYFNGFLEGWPIAFFFSYLYFFFLNVSVRKRMYGDYYVRPHDPKWDVNVPNWCRSLFCAGVMVGHWLTAFEGPELHQVPGGLSNVGIWLMILTAIFTHYNATFYLAKYSEKVVVPCTVVLFGPYRWIRHPIYASTMLLLLAYPVALRAPFSFLLMAAICLLYYNQKAKLEEALMIDEFGDGYIEYMSKVRYRLDMDRGIIGSKLDVNQIVMRARRLGNASRTPTGRCARPMLN